jgi:hypothetical protein
VSKAAGYYDQCSHPHFGSYDSFRLITKIENTIVLNLPSFKVKKAIESKVKPNREA